MTDPRVEQSQVRQMLRRRIAVQRQVESYQNRLIEQMVRLVDDEQVAQGGMEKHQIKNLLGVALDTPSVEVVKHYILYQVGRDSSGTSWRRNRFGDKLVSAIDDLRSEADHITRNVHQQLGLVDPNPEQIDETWMLLLRTYLGQFHRYFYYRKEASQWPQETN